ncbi:DUF3139 domain-containing protein [Paenibacillus dauci]|uniref:DUF3139 domain-containing protein n=1 Tax=Paenibacillus dauci TaxID=1567106 RepID=UPI0006972B8D|nr:DUF3139 domain-containing protein [Paenibacillus dauci]
MNIDKSMIIKNIKALGMLLLTIAAIWSVFTITLSIIQDRMTNKVMTYLVQERGYKESQIAEIETSGISKAPVMSTMVMFRGEPNAMYFYKIEEGKVVQYSQAPAIYDFKQKYIHSEHPDNF